MNTAIHSSNIELVILDRDGVINQDSPNYIKNEDEWHPIDGSIEAITMLKKAGLKVAVATNQSGLGRKLFKLDDLNKMHQKMLTKLQQYGSSIDLIKYCPHLPTAACNCRKPNPGMLQEIMLELNVNPKETIMVGDSYKDYSAAQNAGCHSVIVKTGNGNDTALKVNDPTITYNNLLDFTCNFIKNVKL